MAQLPLFAPPTWTVSDLTRHVRELFEQDEVLQDVWVSGEVSNRSRPASGHLYFTLKDASAALRCVMWRNAVQRQAMIPNDGDAVEVHGSLSVYEAAGQYQLYADTIRPVGEGRLYQEFLQLKARLEAEGLFDPERKRAIPAWPQRIGIVTSPTGAALRDMLNILRRRYPLVEVVLAPSPVQGADAPPGIVQALQALNNLGNIDVILLARGGGSIEDLWAFNDEGVARAIVASAAPVIAGVGHETDFTIADFASDLRAPTPTAAAELATPNKADLIPAIRELDQRLERSLTHHLQSRKWTLEALENRLRYSSPAIRWRDDRQRLDEALRRAGVAVAHHIQIRRMHLDSLIRRSLALSPQAILQRGYALVSKQDGQVVSRVGQVQSGEILNVQVQDGRFGTQVLPPEG